MKTIISMMLGLILCSGLSAQCNKIPEPEIPDGYVIISSMVFTGL